MKTIITLILSMISINILSQELQQIDILRQHKGDVNSVTFSSNGKYLASSSTDKTIIIWNSTNRKIIKTLNGHNDAISCVTFSPNDELLASSSWDYKIKIWNTNNWKLVKTLGTASDWVNFVRFSPNGEYVVASTSNGYIYVWNTTNWNLIKSIKTSNSGSIWSLSFSPNGRLLVIGGSDNTVSVWNTKTWNKTKVLIGHAETVSTVVFSPNGRYIASGSYDKTIKIWDSNTWNEIKTLKKHNAKVWTLSFTKNGNYLGSGDFKGKIIIWDTNNWKDIHRISNEKAIASLAFNSVTKVLASGSWDNTIKLWDISSLKTAYTNVMVSKSIIQDQIIHERRIALVIGNYNYKNDARLVNPKNDADSIANLLKEMDFEVIKKHNLDLRQMVDAVNEFGVKLKDAKENGDYVVGLYYFSGHGMQINGINFLLPLNDNIGGEEDITYESFNSDRVLTKLESSGSSINIVILDACRNNPFEKRFKNFKGYFPNFKPGLSLPNVGSSGTLIAYATSPGRIALDGDGSNSPYVEELLKNIRKPGLTVEQVFKKVRIGVLRRTRETQLPWEANSLIGDFYFVKNQQK